MKRVSEPKFHCVTVIQARRGSSRLPDKILKPLGGVSVLERVIARCNAIQGVDKVVCALPEDSFNDPVAELAEKAGATVSRGSEEDVLARYMGAMEHLDSKYVMRVTSDCPFLDPTLCADLLMGVEEKNVRYGATAWWPHGLDCEVFTKDLLVEAHGAASHPYDREHVTLWMKRRCKGTDYILQADHNYMEEQRWVLDYPEDLAFLERLVTLLPPFPKICDWHRIMELVDADPILKNINAARIAEWQQKTNEIYEEVGRNG